MARREMQSPSFINSLLTYRLQYADEAPDFRPGVRASFIASVAAAQFGRFGDTSPQAHLARPSDYDGKFHYCRAVYRQHPRGDGGSWLTDYPLVISTCRSGCRS